MSSAQQRALQTFFSRPLPTASNRPVTTTVNNPVACFGPFPEGVGVTVSVDVNTRVKAMADKAAPAEAAFTDGAKFQVGVHDHTMTVGCSYVWMCTVTQPPPAGHELNCWPADVGPDQPTDI